MQCQLGHPLELHALGRHDEDAARSAPRLELGNDHARLDGLAETNLIGEQEPDRVGRQRSLEGDDLMR
ncbi:MAG TPA: hypothetical protein VM142_07480 [Acidimicrobiales bacterium]|nr:hypothetical protein [Acidimicrobiales bacterium]